MHRKADKLNLGKIVETFLESSLKNNAQDCLWLTFCLFFFFFTDCVKSFFIIKFQNGTILKESTGARSLI